MDYKNSKAPKNTVTRDINQLMEPVGNVYETVAIIAKRANQISVGMKRELDAKLQDFSIP
jgi:DNA-directed RNA polymerase subunit K/omega